MDFIWIAVIAYIMNGEASVEHKAVRTEVECVELNKRAVEIMKAKPEYEVYGSGCVKVELTAKGK